MALPWDRLGGLFARYGHRVYPDWALRHLVQHLEALPPGSRVLDLGGGTGVLAGAVRSARPDLRVVVADAARGMLAHVPPGVRPVVARAEALPFEEGVFDAVVVGEALHHFAGLEAALSEIARVSREGGRLWVYEFDPRPLPGRLLALAERLAGEPARFLPPDRLADRLAALGYTVRLVVRGFRYLAYGVLSRKASGRSSPSR